MKLILNKMLRMTKTRLMTFILGASIPFIFYLIFNLITEKTIDLIFVFYYWDIMMFIQIGLLFFEYMAEKKIKEERISKNVHKKS